MRGGTTGWLKKGHKKHGKVNGSKGFFHIARKVSQESVSEWVQFITNYYRPESILLQEPYKYAYFVFLYK